MKNIDIVEIDECITKLKMLSNNLMLVRLGLANKDVIPNDEVVDNALFVIEEEIERLAEKIADLLCEEEETMNDCREESKKLIDEITDDWLIEQVHGFIINMTKED